jgi:2-oxoacid:acceptor oxidoreductase gamma subunit (pyruvate/2-ketoisovalerate family)
MKIRFHGRGGQGVVIASRILSFAAFKEGKYSQSLLEERRGATNEAYARISKSSIEIRSKIKNPDRNCS